jgi:hypothetical protein
VLERIDALVSRLGESYRVVPEYASLPEGVMENEVLPVSRGIVEGFLRAAAEGRQPAGEHVEVVERMGRRRLEMGVPLEPILHVYRIAGREVFDEIAAATTSEEKAELASLGRAWMDYIDQASSVAASSYLRASHERLRRIDAQRGALIDALLASVDASDLAAVASEFAVVLASEYVPVLIAGPEVATKVDALAAVAPADSISGYRGHSVLVLVPAPAPALAPLAGVAPDSTIAFGRACGPGPGLAAEVRGTERVLAVATRLGSIGLHGPGSLVLERFATAEPALLEVLRRDVLDPLRSADRAGLVEATLRTYLATGSAPETAAREFVHPNTVSYRLRRVAERTGYDPRIPAQAAVLVLALLGGDLTPS